MKFCKYLNCIIVYGGRNDELNCCFCDIHILNLESFVWIKLNVSDNKYNEGKFSFGCDIFQSQMLIFGGVNFNGFINNDLYVIEFDDSNQKSQVLEEAFEDPIHLEPKIQAKIVSCLRTFLPITVVEKK